MRLCTKNWLYFSFRFFSEHEIVSILEPIPTKGLTDADTDDLLQKVHDIMLKEYEKLTEEMAEKSKDPKWLNKKRPRLTVSWINFEPKLLLELVEWSKKHLRAYFLDRNIFK